MATKKLIEVALPLEKINSAAAYEKMPGIGPHPRGLHLWWARRPFTAARAVIWASLVDDPSSHPEKFPTEEAQNQERQRLFRILEDLVVWENSNDEQVLEAAKEEILRSTGGNPPELLDPFAGGGAIPLEAQRLGLKVHAHDLNPVAVMINKAMIEIPPRFAGMAPVNPEARTSRMPQIWSRAEGLAEDVRYYGEWVRQEAFRRIGHWYPKVKVPREQGGGEATVIAWIWTRTVKCPNPACGCEMPLASSFVLSRKKGREAWIEPQFDLEKRRITYKVRRGKGAVPGAPKTSRGANFKCILCGEATTSEYIKAESLDGRMGAHLMAVVAEGKNGKLYLSPDDEQIGSADVPMPERCPEGAIGGDKRALWTPLYGLKAFSDLFTRRQLTALTTFSALVAEAQKKAEADAVAAGMADDHLSLNSGGQNARAYGETIGVYLAFAVDREADFCNSVCRWSISNEKPMNLFARQGIPMVWDYPEVNVFSHSVGSFGTINDYICKCIQTLPDVSGRGGKAQQHDAQTDCGLRNVMVSTDPPYYDNIGYADLSDYFYVWMRQSLKGTYPELFGTMLVPKAEELIATPYRHDGSVEQSKAFFEGGMLSACRQIYLYAREDIPVTIYYAYKQSDSDTDGTASSGWETMLRSIVEAGLTITGTWPMRTEQTYRAVSMGTNALASSIVLVCRKRPPDAPQTTRRNLINLLRRELRPALKQLQNSNIAPVDLAQSAIGPGMGVFSRFRQVLEADGTPMSVRAALKIINEELDLYFNEQVGDMDAASRFCVELYTQNAFNHIKYGEAEILATAKSTSIPMMASHGILYAKAGIVHLLDRTELPEKVDDNERCIWMLTQQLTQAMARGGVEACARILADMFGSNGERAKDLAYRLYTIAERKNWANEAYAYNALVVAWPDIQARAAARKEIAPEQMNLFSPEAPNS